MSEKVCIVCGRVIEYRKKWAKNWDEIKYCSDRCRHSKKDLNFESAIMELLKVRGAGNTVCPSDVLSEDKKNDPDLLEKVKSSARLLAAKGKIIIMQNGHRVDPSTAKGSIRIKLNQNK